MNLHISTGKFKRTILSVPNKSEPVKDIVKQSAFSYIGNEVLEDKPVLDLYCASGQLGFEALSNPNSPKIVVDKDNYAMYFSRSIIPYVRGFEKEEWLNRHVFLKHIGLYAYRVNVLKEITQIPLSSLEKAESLEQLRWLQNGYRIKVGITDVETIGIDTPLDMKKAEEFLDKNKL